MKKQSQFLGAFVALVALVALGIYFLAPLRVFVMDPVVRPDPDLPRSLVKEMHQAAKKNKILRPKIFSWPEAVQHLRNPELAASHEIQLHWLTKPLVNSAVHHNNRGFLFLNHPVHGRLQADINSNLNGLEEIAFGPPFLP
ncbi:hypothetical protein [Roseibacillus persicicus]|uniref:hypothetical protein n=1 Tax=Roseibacillus persicicus TaxID=454148 RepID=UPI00280C7322|nr:hypothetical protein [Roseibacillus persicicus]MDQ8192350.1 hypothetical protein [Roseibacillus persicicus]